MTVNNLIYPGSFDPFHRGHIDVIRRVCEHFEFDVNLIVLLQRNRFKTTSMFDMEFKFNFLKQSIEDNFPTSNITIRRTEEESFSTYWHITNLYSLDYKLIIGDDYLENITRWHDFKLMQEHGLQLVVIQRDLSYKEISNYKSLLPIYEIILHDKISVENTHNMSSTHIRSQVEGLLTNMCKYKLI